MYKAHLGLPCKFIFHAKVKIGVFESNFAILGDGTPAFLKPFMKTKVAILPSLFVRV